MAYSIPYIILLTLFALCAFAYEYTDDKRRQMIFTMVAFGGFYVFFAFRGYVYTDWMSYAQILKELEWGDFFNVVDEKQTAVIHEPGFTLLCLICKSIVNEYAFLVFVITTIDTFLFLRFLRHWNIKNKPLVLMLFISFEGISIMFNLLRNQIAIFIFLNALEFLRDRKPLRYFLLCTIALSFHLSSILYFPLYFFLHRKINKWVYIGAFCAFFLFYISNISIALTLIKILGLEGILGDKAEFYTEILTSSRQFSPTGTLEKFSLVILVFLYYESLCEKGKHILINSSLIYFFFYFVFAEFKDFSSRLAILFVFSYWILWTELLTYLKIPNNRKIFATLLFLYCFYITLRAYPSPIQEYDNLLFGGKNKQERLKILNKTYEEEL